MNKDLLNFENVTKMLGEINQALYGVNPYKRNEVVVQNPEEPADEEMPDVGNGEKVEEDELSRE